MNKIDALLQRGLKKVWASKSGGVLIYIAFGLPILLGVMALSVDLGRAFILNTELKDFSDAAALAGAAELDGRDGARAAAESAARTGLQGTLVNVQSFSTDGGGAGLVIDQVVFLQNLPADGTDFVAGDTATTDANARFIFVSVVNRDVRSGLSRALGAIPDFNTSAKSIAGFNSVVCRLPAMFMCNPLEDVNFPITEADEVTPLFNCSSADLGEGSPLKHDCLVGRGMLLKNGGGGGAGQGNTSDYFPGEFGLLSCPDGISNNNGIQCVAETIAQATPNVCIANLAFPQTGQGAGPIREAINVRFDDYSNPFYGGNGPSAAKNNALYRPAINVTKGYKPTVGGECAEPVDLADEAAENVARLPRDDCFYDDSCTGGDRYGPGNWQGPNLDVNGIGDRGGDYWLRNHGYDVDDPSSTPGMPAPPANYGDMTRYEIYRYEISTMNFATMALPGSGIPGIPRPAAMSGNAVENGLSCEYSPPDSSNPDMPNFSDPALDSNTTGVDEIDRRLLVLTAVNCIEHGPLHGAQPDGIPVEGYVEVFLTEPTTQGGPEGLRVWGELKGVLEQGNDGIRDIVQLYR